MIVDRREKMIREILDIPFALLDSQLNHSNKQKSPIILPSTMDLSYNCSVMTYGSLVFGLQRMSLYPRPDEVSMSVSKLGIALLKLQEDCASRVELNCLDHKRHRGHCLVENLQNDLHKTLQRWDPRDTIWWAFKNSNVSASSR